MKLIATLLAACSLASPLTATAAASTSGHLEIIERLEPGVWLVRQAEPFQLRPVGNVTVIEQTDGLVLVDSGGSPGSGRRVADLVRTVSDKPVKVVLVTHWHNDHPLGLPAILEAWPDIRVVTHSHTHDHILGPPLASIPKDGPDPAVDERNEEQIQGSEDFLRRNAEDESLSVEERVGFARTLEGFSTIRSDTAGSFVVAPTETFEERLLIDDPVRPVEFLYLGRANTDGDAVAWLPRQRIVATGDIVVAPIPFGFGSYPADWIQTLDRLKALDFTLLVPGHGLPQRDASYVNRLASLIAEVREQVGPLAEEGLELEEVRERVDFAAQRRLFAGDDPWLARWFDRYWVRPMTESAWREALEMEIVQGGG